MILIFVIAYLESFIASHLIKFWISLVRMVFLKNIALCKFRSILKSALQHSVVVTVLPSLSMFGKLIQKLFWFVIVRFCCFKTNKWKTLHYIKAILLFPEKQYEVYMRRSLARLRFLKVKQHWLHRLLFLNNKASLMFIWVEISTRQSISVELSNGVKMCELSLARFGIHMANPELCKVLRC